MILKRLLRVTIVASLAWAVGGSLWAHYAQPSASQAALTDKMCAYRDSGAPKLGKADYVNCTLERTRLEAEAFRERLTLDAFVVAAPIAAGWILFGLMALVMGRFAAGSSQVRKP